MSAIKQYIPNLIQTFQNLGYSLSYLSPNLEELDVFYDQAYPGQTTVTAEIAIAGYMPGKPHQRGSCGKGY